MPVLPLVASMMVLPGLSVPLASPAWIMLSAGRSFTEPPGLNHSALAQNSMLEKLLPTRSRRRSGVFPILARRGTPACASGTADSRPEAALGPARDMAGRFAKVLPNFLGC